MRVSTTSRLRLSRTGVGGLCCGGALRFFRRALRRTGRVPRLVLRRRACPVTAAVEDGAGHDEKDGSAARAARDGSNRHASTTASASAVVSKPLVPLQPSPRPLHNVTAGTRAGFPSPSRCPTPSRTAPSPPHSRASSARSQSTIRSSSIWAHSSAAAVNSRTSSGSEMRSTTASSASSLLEAAGRQCAAARLVDDTQALTLLQ